MKRHSIASHLRLDTHPERMLPISSSNPPKFTLAQEACYREALEVLTKAEVPYAVAGAFALHEHSGIWRDTKDLDIVLEGRHIPDAFRQLQQRGFTTFIEDPIWLAKAYRGEYFIDLITSLGNAVLPVDSSWISRATPITVFDLPCKVLAAEEVIASKLFVSRRERFDGADVAHLIRSQAERLDWARVEVLLGEHWELLLWALIFFAYAYPAHTHLVDSVVWNRLLEKFAEHIRNPDPALQFRGTLIDPNMFAIDVAEWGEQDLYQEYSSRAMLLREKEDKECENEQ